VNRLAQVYLRSRDAHPIGWQFIDLAAGGLTILVLWIVIGSTAGIAFAIFWAAMMVLGIATFLARWAHTRRAGG
jgi:hypothetical protein